MKLQEAESIVLTEKLNQCFLLLTGHKGATSNGREHYDRGRELSLFR